MTASRSSGDSRLGLQITLLAAARLSTVAALFGVTLIAARALPEAGVGSAAVGQTVGMIAALLANGGINIAAIYHLQRDPAQQSTMVGLLTAIASAACVVAVLLVLATAPLTFWLVGSTAWPLVLAATAMSVAMISFEFAGAVQLGLGNPGRFTMLEVVRGWASLLAVWLLVAGPGRADAGIVLGLALGYAAAAVVGLAWTNRAGISIVPRYDPNFTRSALAFGMRGQVGNVFQFLGVRLDLLLVPALVDLPAAGIYFVAVRIADVVGQAATAASSLVFPQVAGESDRSSTRITEGVVRLTIITVVLGSAAFAWLATPLLGFVFGEAYREGATALIILLVATVPLAVGRVIAADLKGRGRPGLVSVAAAISVVATVALDVALIPVLGIEGAALASLLTYTTALAALLAAYRSVTRGSLVALLPKTTDIGHAATWIQRRQQ